MCSKLAVVIQLKFLPFCNCFHFCDMMTGVLRQSCQLRFSEKYSIDSIDSIEFVKKHFLVIFIFKITKISILQNIQILKKTMFRTFNF